MFDDDKDLLPPADLCAEGYCQKPRAAHVGWAQGGPHHDFKVPERTPKPEVMVSAHIETEWTCSRCGEDLMVWGVAEEWMECEKCGRYSFLVPFATD
jgi:ribosomal protein S27E